MDEMLINLAELQMKCRTWIEQGDILISSCLKHNRARGKMEDGWEKKSRDNNEAYLNGLLEDIIRTVNDMKKE